MRGILSSCLFPLMSPTSPSLPRVLTGITTTGSPHLGNYAGAIRPAIAASRSGEVDSFFFLADLHGLIKCPEPARIQRSTLEIAACWLAAGLDPERVTFYRQSDIPEIPQLCWYLTCVTAKGLLNRAHAYKAANDRNREAGQDPDADVTAGLYMYPVLMAADILAFSAHRVPVGIDQVQHLEIARDVAQRFNHVYGEVLTLPQVQIDEQVGTLPGLDGRKMSKSYNNTIGLFVGSAQLQRLIAGIVTDSTPPGEPKQTQGSALFQLYQAFASPEETAAFARAFADGIGWGDAKQALFEMLDRTLAPMRERYTALVAEPEAIEKVLAMGADKARAVCSPLVAAVREAVGIRTLVGTAPARSAAAAGVAAGTVLRPMLKQYRGRDGMFYFKLQTGEGDLLLQSLGFSDPKEGGACIGRLKANPQGWMAEQNHLQAVPETGHAAVVTALRQLAEG